MENEEPKSSSSIHIRNIANDLSSDEVYKNNFDLNKSNIFLEGGAVQ